MFKKLDRTRRHLLLCMVGVFAAGPLRAAQEMWRPTPTQTPGPFYPIKLPLDDDNDLTHVRGQSTQAKGRITDLSGRLLDLNGNPLQGVRIEIWQCDANGRYRHPRETGNRPIDKGFQGHGHTVSVEDGAYRFRTIRPVPYPGRTPHIHVAVFPPGERPFTTQLYVKGEPRNTEDFLFIRVPVERRELVMAEFLPVHETDVELRAQFDIVLGGIGGTPGG